MPPTSSLVEPITYAYKGVRNIAGFGKEYMNLKGVCPPYGIDSGSGFYGTTPRPYTYRSRLSQSYHNT